MFTNEDKEFLSDLNDKLAKSLSSALEQGNRMPEKDSGSSKDPENTEEVKKNTKAVAAVSVSISMLSNIVGKVTNASRSFGDTLARSTAATGKSLQIAGTRFDSATGKFTNELPGISESFKKFGFSLPQAAAQIDTAIRMNVRDTGRGTQKFIATATGLGNNMSTVGRFLTTQTNALGNSTEATTAFGESILATAAANGVLADSIFEAVDAFRDTTKEQSVFFGRESAKVTENFVRDLAAIGLKDLDTNAILQALTSPKALERMSAVTGQLRISMPTDLSDPAQMRSFIRDAIPALAKMGEELEGTNLAGVKRQEALAQRLSEAFSPKLLHDAMRVNDALKEQGKTMADLGGDVPLSTDSLDSMRGTMLRTSDEANTNALFFDESMRAMVGSRMALDKLTTVISDDLPTSTNHLTNLFYGLDTALNKVGQSIIGLATTFGVTTAAMNMAGSLGKGGGVGGTFTLPTVTATTKGGKFMQGMKGAKALKMGGLGAGIAGGLEFMESGDVTRSVTRGAAQGLTTMGATKLGAGLGAMIGGPVGALIGGGAGLVGSMFFGDMVSDLAVRAHDALGLYEGSEEAASAAAEQQPTETSEQMLNLMQQMADSSSQIAENTAVPTDAGSRSSAFTFDRPSIYGAGRSAGRRGF